MDFVNKTLEERLVDLKQKLDSGMSMQDAIHEQYQEAIKDVPLRVLIGGVLEFMDRTGNTSLRKLISQLSDRLDALDPTYAQEETDWRRRTLAERAEREREAAVLVERKKVEDSIRLGGMLERVDEELSVDDLLVSAGYDSWLTSVVPMEDRAALKKLVELEAAKFEYTAPGEREVFRMDPLLLRYIRETDWSVKSAVM